MPFRVSSLLSWRPLRGLLVVIASVSLAGAGSAQSLPVSLPEDLMPELREILVRAAQEAPTVQSSNIQAARVEANYITARSTLLPSVYGSASYNWSTQEVEDVPLSESKSDGLYYSFYASQPIFHWGALKAQTDIAKLERLISTENNAEVYRALSVTLRSQYLALILKKMALRNQEFAEKISEELLAVQEERLLNRTISTGDILGTRLSAEENRYYTSTARQDLEASARVFGRLAGQTGFTADRIPDLIPRPEFSAEVLATFLRQLSSETLRDLPQAAMYELQIEQNRKTYHVERTRLLPKFNASANYGVQNITNATPLSVAQTAVVSSSFAIGANWTIFDGLASRGGRLAALAARRLNERYLDTFLETTMLEMRALQDNIDSAGRLMDLTERRLALAWEAVRLARADLEQGRASQPAVNSITSDARSAELRAASARSNFLSLWAQYVSLAGADPMMDQLPRAAYRSKRTR